MVAAAYRSVTMKKLAAVGESSRAAADAQTKIEQPPNENRRELPLG
jgi:hypothetical protein